MSTPAIFRASIGNFDPPDFRNEKYSFFSEAPPLRTLSERAMLAETPVAYL